MLYSRFIIRVFISPIPCDCDFCDNKDIRCLAANLNWTIKYYCPDCLRLEWWSNTEHLDLTAKVEPGLSIEELIERMENNGRH